MEIKGVIPKYFSYDVGTVDDETITLMIDELGLEGLGIKVLLDDKLASNPEHRLHIKYIPILARNLHSH
jgi:hypothetical protein